MALTRRLLPGYLLLAALPLAAQRSPRELALPRTLHPPLIDGVLGDDAWRGAAVLADWVQTRPGDNTAPHARTTAWLTWDANGLYIAVKAEAGRGETRALLHERDAVDRQAQDYIAILLDTFNDRRRAFGIFVNPRGIQGDQIRIEGADSTEWDGVFDSAGRVGDDGYVIEVGIPFKSLRYPGGERQRWGFGLTRVYGRNGLEDSPWPLDRDRACNLCQMITLTGLDGLRPNRTIEINPALVTSLNAGRDSIGGPWRDAHIGNQLGVNAKVGLGPGLTLDATWNPDFSQVEADAGQLEVNNRFALFFPEKRPFFLEATDVLQSRAPLPGQFADFTPPPIDLVYTRRIVDPDGGARLTGKLGRVRFGAIAALDAAHDYALGSPIGGLTPGELDPWDGHRVRVGVARAKADLLSDGYVGGTLTARQEGDGHQVTVASDTRFRLGRNTSFRLIAAHSESRNPTLFRRVRSRLVDRLGTGPGLQNALDSLPEEVTGQDGERRTGNGLQAQVEYDSRHWSMGIGYEDLTRNFETALGYSPRTDVALLAAKIENIYRSAGFVQELRTKVRFEHGYDHDADHFFSLGHHTDFLLAPSIEVLIPGQTDLSVGYTRAFVRFDGVDFSGLDRGFVFASTQAIRQVGFELFARAGQDVIFDDVVDEGPPLPDFFVTATLSAAIRPASELRVDLSTALARVWRRTPESDRESRYGQSAIPRAKATLQVSSRLGLRGIAEYRYERFYSSNGAVARKRDGLSTEFLATYLIHPGQSIQMGWSQLGRGDMETPLTAYRRGAIAKISWLWRL